MIRKSHLAAALTSAGIMALGWQVGTLNGATLASGTANSTNTNSTNTAGTSVNSSTTTAAASAKPVSTTSASGFKDGTYTGTSVAFRYGSIQDTVTIKGGVITDVTAKYSSDGDRKSEMIDSQAIPMLKSQVLAANSADISTVGGATFTSQAYITSLQSALDQAK